MHEYEIDSKQLKYNLPHTQVGPRRSERSFLLLHPSPLLSPFLSLFLPLSYLFLSHFIFYSPFPLSHSLLFTLLYTCAHSLFLTYSPPLPLSLRHLYSLVGTFCCFQTMHIQYIQLRLNLQSFHRLVNCFSITKKKTCPMPHLIQPHHLEHNNQPRVSGTRVFAHNETVSQVTSHRSRWRPTFTTDKGKRKGWGSPTRK